MKYKRILCAFLALCFLAGCTRTGSDPTPQGHTSISEQSTPAAPYQESSAASQENVTTYQAPPFAGSAFHDVEEVDGVKLDLSAVSQGYVAVSAKSEMRLKFKVMQGDNDAYVYDLNSDGTPSIFPLQSGNGEYTFKVMENVEGTSYAAIFAQSAEVTLEDEFQPFLRPSDYVDYAENSKCVAKAKELAGGASTQLDVVGAVLDYVCETVEYDYDKAATVTRGELQGYLSDPDETLDTGMGICIDYAALVASMLRSQGIPTKMIYGWVSSGEEEVYHAWNMFYTDETGWVTVGYQTSKNSWNRLDPTFSANGADGTFIGDGGNYADVYIY